MKKIMGIALIALLFASSAYAATIATQSASVTVTGVLSVEFASTTDTTFGSGSILWTSVDPALGNLIAPTGGDRSGSATAKMDTGVICKANNAASNWYLKMSISGTLAGKVKYYMPQPRNRNVTPSTTTDGTLAQATPGTNQDWPVITSTSTTVYTSGTVDKINTPFGTFVGVSYGLNPVGLASGTPAAGTITYTITATP